MKYLLLCLLILGSCSNKSEFSNGDKIVLANGELGVYVEPLNRGYSYVRMNAIKISDGSLWRNRRELVNNLDIKKWN